MNFVYQFFVLMEYVYDVDFDCYWIDWWDIMALIFCLWNPWIMHAVNCSTNIALIPFEYSDTGLCF